MTTRVGAHRLQGQRGVLQALALGDAGALGGEVDHVGRQPLGRRLERDPGPGGVLEEQVDHGAAAQRGSFLIGRSAMLASSSAVSRIEQRVVAAQVRRRDQVPVHSALPTPAAAPSRHRVLAVGLGRAAPGPPRAARSAGSCRRSRRGWAAPGGRGRPGRRAARRAGRPRSFSASRAARTVRPENSTSSTRTTILPSMPAGGTSVRPSARAGRSRRSSRYMVMSSEPVRDRTALDLLRCRAARRRASGTPRVGMPSSTTSPAPLVRSRISWAIRVSARRISAALQNGLG